MLIHVNIDTRNWSHSPVGVHVVEVVREPVCVGGDRVAHQVPVLDGRSAGRDLLGPVQSLEPTQHLPAQPLQDTYTE